MTMPRSLGSPVLLATASAGFAAAAVIHAMVVPEHLAEDPLYGAFFIVTSVLQAAAAVLVVAHPSRRVLRAGVVGTVALIALWAYTRTVGVPVGRSAGQIEGVGTLDLMCQVFQLLSVVTGVMLLAAQSRMPSAQGSNSGQAGPSPHW